MALPDGNAAAARIGSAKLLLSVNKMMPGSPVNLFSLRLRQKDSFVRLTGDIGVTMPWLLIRSQ